VSRHLRSGFAAFFLVAGFSTPAASNALTDFFSPNPAPEQPAAAATPAQDDCLPRPGQSTAAGGHWVYRYDGHRKCWFQAAEDSAAAKKRVRHRVARRRVAVPEQDKSALRRQKDIEDARAELVSPAPAATPQPAPPEPAAQTPQPAPSEPKLTIVHAVSVRVADAAGLVPPAPVPAKPVLNEPVLNKPGADQLTSDQPAPRHVDVEALLAEAPAASEAVASAPPATPIAAPAATGGGEEGTPTWLGALLMALGGAALLSASGALRRALWPVRSPDPATELPVIAHGGRDEPSFARSASVSPASGETSLSAATRRVGPRTARARRPLAAVPTQEAF